MKTTHQWLESLVKTGLSPEVLAERITFAGLEVEHVSKLGDGDTQYSIEVTSNRVDALGMYGLAREVHAVTGQPMTLPTVKVTPEEGDPKVKVSIEDAARAACPHYTAQVIEGVRVGESPDWLRTRLLGVGCAPVNTVVDITNFVMFEMSQPLHAFDLAKVRGREIRVRMAAKGEK
jgi:phenylalanyl-tRNA synthetase beta chain